MTPRRQLALDLPVRTASGRDAFFVSEANQTAVRQIDAWAAWPGARLLLIGPKSSGKSHLATIWADEAHAIRVTGDAIPESLPEHSAAVLVEDIDRIAGRRADETRLFHLFNQMVEAQCAFLMTARQAPTAAGYVLPDLASRLAAMAVARLDPPDDALHAAVLMKLFGDRQLNVDPATLRLIVERTDRSLSAAADIVAALDRLSLEHRKPINATLVRQVIAAQSGESVIKG